jgi:hypothetical protein
MKAYIIPVIQPKKPTILIANQKKYEVFYNKSLLDIHPNAITNIGYNEGCPEDDNSKFCIQLQHIGKNRCMEVV